MDFGFILGPSWEGLVTRWLNTTQGQHTKQFFIDFLCKITISKVDAVTRGGPKMVPRWPNMVKMASRCPTMVYLRALRH